MDIKIIQQNDLEIANAITEELQRQRNKIELIASENFVSLPIMEAMGTILTNKYAEGYPDKRYYGGCEFVDKVENIARNRLKSIFGADHVNVQPHSGANANIAVYFALLNPGDTVLGMSLAHGGHLTHGSPVNVSGKYFNFASYGTNEKDGLIDYDQVRALAKEKQPKLIVAGASAYPRKINFKIFREIADEVGAYFMVDMAHIAGLVAARLHQNPVEYADVVTTTTHKTLRGPRGGAILCKSQFAAMIDKAIFPGMQGGPLMHVIAAKAICFKEAMSREFKDYQIQVVKNASTLAQTLINNGIKLVSDGTDNHLLLIDLRNKNLTGKAIEIELDELGITVNKNSIPYDTQSPFITSGIRIGTPAVTTRGFKEAEMIEIGNIITDVIDKKDNKEETISKINGMCKKYPLYSQL